MLCAENITIDVSNWDLSETNSLKELFYHSYAKEIK
jgi:surface protein